MFKSLFAFLIAFNSMHFASAFESGRLRPAPKSAPHSALVKSIDGKWNDNNISTGTTRVSAVQFNSSVPQTSSGWLSFSEELFLDQLDYYAEQKPSPRPKIETVLHKFSAQDVEAMARAVADGNAFDISNPENTRPLSRQIWAMVRSLGDLQKLYVTHTQAKLIESSSEELRLVQSFSVVNRKSGDSMVIFVIEGTM